MSDEEIRNIIASKFGIDADKVVLQSIFNAVKEIAVKVQVKGHRYEFLIDLRTKSCLQIVS